MRRVLIITLLLVVAATCAVGIVQTASAAGHGHCVSDDGQVPMVGTTADRLLLGVLGALAFLGVFTRAVSDFARTADASFHRWRNAFFRAWVPLPVLLASQATDDPQVYAPAFQPVSWCRA